MKYELTLLIEGKASSAKKKKIIQTIEKIVNSVSGKVVKAKDWGLLDLAYPIKKAKNGIYLFWEIEVLPSKVKTIKDKLRLEGDILRYLLVKTD